MEQVIGISESKIDNTIKFMSNIESRIGLALDTTNDLISNSSGFFKCSATSEINRILDEINSNIQTIKKNISMYPKDMNKVKARFGEVEVTSSKQIKEAINNMEKYSPYEEQRR